MTEDTLERGWVVFGRPLGQKDHGHVGRYGDEETAQVVKEEYAESFPSWVFWVQFSPMTDQEYTEGKVAP